MQQWSAAEQGRGRTSVRGLPSVCPKVLEPFRKGWGIPVTASYSEPLDYSLRCTQMFKDVLIPLFLCQRNVSVHPVRQWELGSGKAHCVQRSPWCSKL